MPRKKATDSNADLVGDSQDAAPKGNTETAEQIDAAVGTDAPAAPVEAATETPKFDEVASEPVVVGVDLASGPDETAEVPSVSPYTLSVSRNPRLK